MDPIHYLKQLKSIEPDAEFSARTRAHLMSLTPHSPRLTLAHYLRSLAQSGGALALASVALILILGGLPFDTAHPVVGTPLDPASITAEAQAIDIQVQLSGLEYAYEEAAAIAMPGETTLSGRPTVNFKETNPVIGVAPAPLTGTGVGAGSTSTPPLATSTATEPAAADIEDALDFLAE